ncbi:hypothetical protein [Tenacibaculum larymnensis]|uniref:Uncharacterized protein n=1 Tax=Tenacibaculum larymnensis TaxID=2878201 RepID=A0A9X4EPL5_9FLAO|nr:hypothetical protein [Tenacibaculum larymnensis]MDE1206969.1 hypothetical protein [Tenacibaculum larymnensis]
MEYKKEKIIQQKNNNRERVGKNAIQLKDNRSKVSISKKAVQLRGVDEEEEFQLKSDTIQKIELEEDKKAFQMKSKDKVIQNVGIIQRGKKDKKKKRTGKKGETYGDIGSGYSQEDLEEARRRTGGISAHGSKKSGAGISDKTKQESRLFTSELRSIKAEKKEARRIAKITGHKKYDPSSKQTAKMSDFDKAANRARELSSTEDQEAFDKYLEKRGYEFTDEELDELYAILYAGKFDIDEFQDDKKPDKDDEEDHDHFGDESGSLITV